MSGVRLSPKHGLNPTLPVCFWCGEETGEIALMGQLGSGNKDVEAPKHMVLGYEPCGKCRLNWAKGLVIIEATETPNSVTDVPMREGAYPTGRYAVIKREAAARAFPNYADQKAVFIRQEQFSGLLGDKNR